MKASTHEEVVHPSSMGTETLLLRTFPDLAHVPLHMTVHLEINIFELCGQKHLEFLLASEKADAIS